MFPAVVHNPSVLRRTLVQRNISLLCFSLTILSIISSCSSTRKGFNPHKKFSANQLKEDYQLFQTILEQKHPSLYWYSSKFQMDSAFEAGRQLLKDSMTEYEFRNVLSLVAAKIQCGHTSVRASKSYQQYFDTLKTNRSFPFSVKTWGDTMVLTAPVKNTPLVRGDIIDSINGLSSKRILDTLLRFVPADGDNNVAQSQLLSGSSYFASLYTSVLGWPEIFRVAYTDVRGRAKQAIIQPLKLPKDGPRKAQKKPKPRKNPKSGSEKRKEQRSLQIFGHNEYAIMQVHSFSERLGLKKFFRRSFKSLADSGVRNLIIDLRLNGGGQIRNSNYLTRSLAEKPFKTGDSIYTIKPSFKYGRYIKRNFIETLFVFFCTKKREGRYHFRHLENKRYPPKKRNHYSGNIYILTGGYTYSASILVLNAVRHQPNLTIVGEPSGGAAYGNTAMMIPDVCLPHSKVRFRLPLFRLVMDRDIPKNGRGVEPDVHIRATPEAIRKGIDVKMEKTMELIKSAANIRKF